MAGLDDIKKLSPEERIRRLKELEEERKKEIKEAEELMKSSKDEIVVQEKIKRDIPIPQLKAVDIDHLFSRAEKEMFEAKHGQRQKGLKDIVTDVKPQKKEEVLPEALPLEEAVALEQAQLTEEQLRNQQEYLQQLAMTPLEQLHQEAQDIYKQFKDQGYTTQEQQQRAAELYQAVQMKEEAAKSGNYDAAKQIIDDIDPTKRMLNMLGGYKEVPG